jgi:hypothetical protein
MPMPHVRFENRPTGFAIDGQVMDYKGDMIPRRRAVCDGDKCWL